MVRDNALETIAYVKIFPPLGIARVGNSLEPEGFFIGPEGLDPTHSVSAHPYKDASGAVLRQGARFRVYAFDASDQVLGELTAKEASIVWKVALANRKAEWFEFHGAAEALRQFASDGTATAPLRNHTIAGNERGRRLVIGPAEATIAGESTHDTGTSGERYTLVGQFQGVTTVYLGELRTDESGRLIVLGGRGQSAALDATGKDISSERWITHYANNDFWHDDTSDGPVTCTVHIGAREIEVKEHAWVLVTPPDFAPAVTNIVTLFDVMEEVALDHSLPHPGLPPPQDVEPVEFWRDIYPILSRAVDYRWVSDLGLRGHGPGKGGNFLEEQTLTGLADPKDEAGRLLRKAFFGRIRKPPSLRTADEATAQANGYFMPALSGDEGDCAAGKPDHWLTVTALQYRRLSAWAEDRFTPGTRPTAREPHPQEEPAALTRAALEACAGGAFYPGIEMTAIARSKAAYSEAYRLAKGLRPGDVTKFMACPWQADFFECNTHWWPAQRPDVVITATTLEGLERAFAYERQRGQMENLMFVRQPWGRGLEFERPSMSTIQSRLLPPPTKPSESLDAYLNELASSLSSGFAGIFDQIPPTSETLAERVPQLSRIQFLLQEQFGRFGGRFFHFIVPPPPDSAHPPGANVKERAARIDHYKSVINQALTSKILSLLTALTRQGDSSADYAKRLGDLGTSTGGFDQGTALYESNVIEDFHVGSEHFHKLSVIELVQCAGDALYLAWSQRSGDNGMVTRWHRQGFVVEQTITGTSPAGTRSVVAQVERERSRLSGLEMRDYYYLLTNIEQFPEMYRYSARIAERFLQEARDAIDKQKVPDSGTVILETYFDYDAVTFGAKLAEIYEYYRAQAVNMRPWEIDEARSDLLRQRIKSAPYNQNDGAWLRFVANAGTSDEVRGLLFDVWSDEFGNGNPALHHGNLFTTLLRSLNVVLPGVTSREYADYPGFSDSDFAPPVFELAISQNADRYFPEIIGMTLYLEWEVLQLGGTIKRLDYHGIDSQFWRMHVGIDNAADGHGAKARQAVEAYLDGILTSSGRAAMQSEWKRIWEGFVAFAIAGYGYLGSDDDVKGRRPPTMYDRMTDLISRKRPYGSLNHHNRKLGENRINDWFDDADGFLDELAHSSYVQPGNPDQSRLLNYLTTFQGPMFEVFSVDDLALWHDWIAWLGYEGDTDAVKSYQNKAESMHVLLLELRSSALGAEGHLRYQLKGKPLHEWFRGDLVDLMSALAEPDSQWVVKWDAASSPLVRDFASRTNRMAHMLDRRFPSLGNQVGRLVIVRWINAGCPIPGQPIPAPRAPSVLRAPRVHKATLVEAFGQGFVH